MPPPPPDVHYKTVVSVRQWRFHCGHSILSWFSGNEELFKERDQKDDEFLDRLKEFKIDSTDPQSEKVRKPNNEGWLTSSDVLFQSIQWPVETSKFGSCGQFLPGKGGGGVILGAGGKDGGEIAWSQTNLQEIYFHVLFNVWLRSVLVFTLRFLLPFLFLPYVFIFDRVTHVKLKVRPRRHFVMSIIKSLNTTAPL